jgi:hypothetical protein
MSSIQISEWYDLVSGPDLEQGDILEACPVLRPSADLDWSNYDSLPNIGEIGISLLDVVVVSQSCDIVTNQKSDMWLVVLCPLWRLSDVGKANPYLNSSYGKEECRRGNLPGYHMIAGSDHQRCHSEISIVSFRELWSLPLNFVRKFAASREQRRRIRSPYKEHLSQALARYFMRVGLPSEVPSFKDQNSKNENEAMKALNKLDSNALARVLTAFGPSTPPTIKMVKTTPRKRSLLGRIFRGSF